MIDHHSRPTFQEACQRQHVTWEMLSSALDPDINRPQARYFYSFGQGYPAVVDACLEALTRLTGTRYSLEHVACIVWEVPR